MCNVLSQHEEIFRFEFGTPGFKSSLDIQSSFVEHAEGLAVYVLTYIWTIIVWPVKFNKFLSK